MSDMLLTIKQAAEFLGISKKTLYRYDEQGILKPLRMSGGHTRYRKSDLVLADNGNLGRSTLQQGLI